ncbi:MAG: sulfite exporter TauE/SafE family protein [Clostridia bacterium]|nr:sulfite exporter TauE/SafE family protein [Clostridia bacterium]
MVIITIYREMSEILHNKHCRKEYRFNIGKHKDKIFGFLIGVVNGLFGAGGGMIAVPLLKSCGADQKQAHAGSLAIILPLSVVSAIIYSFNENVDFSLSLKLIPFGIIGSLLGTFIMKKIDPAWLKRIFALVMIYSGIRMLFS